jgi:hypothetical protein
LSIRLAPLAGLIALAALWTATPHAVTHPAPGSEPEDSRGLESDWFVAQRAFPDATIPHERYLEALERAKVDRAALSLRARGDAAMSGGLTWQLAGPTNIGGRITAIASVAGGNPAYIGSANGGVFKSTNGGVNWTPIFDVFGIPSIGAITIDPSSSSTIYVGTGEANSSVDSYDGAGIYRSDDAGQTWRNLGLMATRRIARIAVDPSDPSRIFVAAMGTQFSTSPDRGLYRSEDGGQTWSQVLFVSDSTGACDVAINPAHPETLYCATWERVRRATYRRAYGPECGIWRSVDHGSTWSQLTSGLPLPSDNLGRIGLAIAPSRPSTVYAQITSGASGGYVGIGFYRSLDGGNTWARRDGGTYTGNFGGFSWYFGDVTVSPTNPDLVYSLGVALIQSSDGGVSWGNVASSTHADQHALWIDPSNTNRSYLGNDGGLFYAVSGIGSWTKSVDLPITQFYNGAIDPSNVSRLLGGAQDNSSIQTSGPVGSWTTMLGGDGFQCLVDPTNPNIVFAEYQFCSNGSGLLRSASGGSGGFVTPSGFVSSDRYNWDTPIAMDPQNHNVLLVGSQRVYKSTTNGSSYTAVSGDLTTNPVAQLTYGTISALEISPVDGTLYYAGTDDGRVWRSNNSGGSWTEISAGLPVRYVTHLTADPGNSSVVYITLSGFVSDEHVAHVYRSTDQGAHWNAIGAGLPNAPANDLVVDPAHLSTLFVATDVGVYATQDLGGDWFPLGNGIPISQVVDDLTLHAASRTLVAATHGRSQWKLDLNGLSTDVPVASATATLSLSAPVPNPSRTLARFSIELARAARIDLAIFDPAGRRIATLMSGTMDAGRRETAWNGEDASGRRAPAGVYYVRAATPGAVMTRRLVRL